MGGNLSFGNIRAQRIDSSNRKKIISILNQGFKEINSNYSKYSKGNSLWNEDFLSGSSTHFFNHNISDKEFEKVKPTVGDIDTQVDRQQKEIISAWLSDLKSQTKIGPAIFLYAKPTSEQYVTLWSFPEIDSNIQIDLELKTFLDNKPTKWSKFSQSSAWVDLENGIKGVFHKYLIQSLAVLSKKEFVLRKLSGRGKARKEHDSIVEDTMMSFAVNSKEGGGLRYKYELISESATPVYRMRPTTGYEQDIIKIFVKMFDGRITQDQLLAQEENLWSFMGLLDIINTILTTEEKQKVLNGFIDKVVGPGAQGLYVNNPGQDCLEKSKAIVTMVNKLHLDIPASLSETTNNYIKNYRLT